MSRSRKRRCVCQSIASRAWPAFADSDPPLLLISILEMIMLAIAAVMTHRSHATGLLAFFGTPQFVVTAMLFTIPICAAQLVIRNAVVVLLPGWAVRSAEEQRGFP